MKRHSILGLRTVIIAFIAVMLSTTGCVVQDPIGPVCRGDWCPVGEPTPTSYAFINSEASRVNTVGNVFTHRVDACIEFRLWYQNSYGERYQDYWYENHLLYFFSGGNVIPKKLKAYTPESTYRGVVSPVTQEIFLADGNGRPIGSVWGFTWGGDMQRVVPAGCFQYCGTPCDNGTFAFRTKADAVEENPEDFIPGLAPEADPNPWHNLEILETIDVSEDRDPSGRTSAPTKE